ncbi:MAG: hypothetical protein QM715_02040 [Nibricoccus sp.]
MRIPSQAQRTKPAAEDFIAITMTDRKHALMCEQMLLSMQRTWSELPTVRLLVDDRHGSVNTKRLQRSYGGLIQLVDWAHIIEHHKNRQRLELIEFAEGNLLGRKLAFILSEADQQKTLWIDNDILFFQDFLPLVQAQPDGVFVGATRDSTFGGSEKLASYAPGLARHLFQGDASVPSVNSGLTLASGCIYDAFQLAPLVKHTLDTREHSYFTEQTVIAWAALRSRKIIWDMQVVRLDDTDIYQLGPSPTDHSWRARHYTGNIRHLFWRDAFFLRFRGRNKISHAG